MHQLAKFGFAAATWFVLQGAAFSTPAVINVRGDDACSLFSAHPTQPECTRSQGSDFLCWEVGGLKCVADKKISDCACRFDMRQLAQDQIFRDLSVVATWIPDPYIDGETSEFRKEIDGMSFSKFIEGDQPNTWYDFSVLDRREVVGADACALFDAGPKKIPLTELLGGTLRWDFAGLRCETDRNRERCLCVLDQRNLDREKLYLHLNVEEVWNRGVFSKKSIGNLTFSRTVDWESKISTYDFPEILN